MQNKTMNLTPEYIIDVILRRRWYIIIPFCLCMLAGIFYTVRAPKIYEASTLILIEPQRVPESYVQSIVDINPGVRIDTISEQLNSRTNMEKIIRDFNLFSNPEQASMLLEDKVRLLGSRVSIEFSRASGRRQNEVSSFLISFRGKDPDKTMKITNTLASFLIDENIKTRESQAVGTSDFLNEELNAMRTRLVEVEGRLEKFRKLNMGELPEQLTSNLAILERLQEGLSDRLQSVREEKNRLAVLDQLLATPAPVTLAGGQAQSQPSVGESSDLDVLKEQLSVLTSKYTDRHPDVVKVKKMIAELEKKQANALQAANDTRGPDTTDASPRPNLRDENFRQRQEVRLGINRMEAEIGELRNQVEYYQNRVEATPKREQELASLQRDYENIQTAYNSLLERKLEADIAVNMEKKQKGEQFQVLDAAVLPQRPVSPDMRKLFLIFLAAGLGLGGGIVFLLEYLDTSFRRPEDIESLGLSVLSTIPVIASRRESILHSSNQVLTVLSLTILFILFAGFFSLSFLGQNSVSRLIDQLIQV